MLALRRVLPSVSRSVVAASRISLPAVSRPFSADSHDDFKPKKKADLSSPDALKSHVEDIISKHKVVLFMKGTPDQPMCGFSAQVVRLLHAHGADVHGVDILSNPELRTYMKTYSEWPTFPQLYINKEFVGGCDITTAMHQSGELEQALKNAK